MDIDKVFDKVPYEKLYAVPVWQRYAVMFGISILVIVAFYFGVITEKVEALTKLDTDLSTINTEVTNNESLEKNEGLLKAKIAELEAAKESASKHLPSDKEIPELLEQVSKLGTERGLEFLTFKPLAEVRQTFYAEVPVSLEVTGKFHDVLMFFDDISLLPRIVTIGDMKIQSLAEGGGGRSAASSKGGRESKSSNVQMSCVATTYRFLPESVGKANIPASDKTADKDKAVKKEASAK